MEVASSKCSAWCSLRPLSGTSMLRGSLALNFGHGVEGATAGQGRSLHAHYELCTGWTGWPTLVQTSSVQSHFFCDVLKNIT